MKNSHRHGNVCIMQVLRYRLYFLPFLHSIAILGLLLSPASVFGFVATHRQRHINNDKSLLPDTHIPAPAPTIISSSSLMESGKKQHQQTVATSSSSLSSSSSSSSTSTTEFGEISASNAPPRLNPTLTEAALKRLPWEIEDDIGGEGEDKDDEEHDIEQRWYETRQLLTKLWILPRDMSNGSFEAYAKAANKGEEKMLNSVPQLLRLDSEGVAASAKTVLTVLKLPPAMLRREPMLLTMIPERLVGGFGDLLLVELKKIRSNNDDGGGLKDTDDDKDVNSLSTVAARAVRESCKDAPELLLEAATNWKKEK